MEDKLEVISVHTTDVSSESYNDVQGTSSEKHTTARDGNARSSNTPEGKGEEPSQHTKDNANNDDAGKAASTCRDSRAAAYLKVLILPAVAVASGLLAYGRIYLRLNHLAIQLLEYCFWSVLGRLCAKHFVQMSAVAFEAVLQTDRAVYFLLTLSDPISRALTVIAMCLAWLFIMSSALKEKELFNVILRVHVCIVLAVISHLIERITSSSLALHFQAKNQWDSLRSALRTEYFLVALSSSSKKRRAREREILRKRVVEAMSRQSKVVLSETHRIKRLLKPRVRNSVISSGNGEPNPPEADAPNKESRKDSFRSSSLKRLCMGGDGEEKKKGGNGKSASDSGMGTKPELRRDLSTASLCSTDDEMAHTSASDAASTDGINLTMRAVLKKESDAMSVSTEISDEQDEALLMSVANAEDMPTALDVTRAASYLSSQGNLTITGALKRSRQSRGSEDEDGGLEITSRQEAEEYARNLYDHVRMRREPAVLPRDFEDFLPPELAKEAFEIFDDKGLGVLYQGDFLRTVVEVYRRRRGLARTLNDAEKVVTSIGTLINVVLGLANIFMYLGVFGLSMNSLWLVFSSLILATAFAFGQTVSQIFEAVTLLVLVHPMDVGDSIIWQNEKFFVTELGLRQIGLKRMGVPMLVPTHKMAGTELRNLSRVSYFFDSVEFVVDMSLSKADIAKVEEALRVFLASDPSTYGTTNEDDVAVLVSSTSAPLKCTMYIFYRVNISPGEFLRVFRAKSRVLLTVQHVLVHELNVSYTMGSGTITGDMSGKSGLFQLSTWNPHTRRENVESYES
ncbi:EF-hand domain-containing protein [Pseudoscourfieldia marina]